MVFLFNRSKLRRHKGSLRGGFPTVVRNTSKLLEPCFAVLIPNVGFKPVFKPVAINLESSYSSFNSVLVDFFVRAKIIST